MTMRLPTLFLAAAAALALPAMAHAQVADPADAEIAPAAPTAPAAPAEPAVKRDVAAIIPAEYAGNPEWMLALDLSTGGRVVIQLRPDIAPDTVARVKELARAGFYDGIVFHRVIDEFMAQTGDPSGTGTGGSTLPDLHSELSIYPHLRGTVSMARAASFDSANSQFFIVFQPRFSLDRNYTAFGRVVTGMNYVDAIHRGEPPAAPSRIVQASIVADGKPVPPPALLTETLPTVPAAADISVEDLNAPIVPQNDGQSEAPPATPPQ